MNINFYPLDEEIVTDPDKDMFNENDTYVKSESVNEWDEIEIEISTTLPNISAQDMEYEGFTYSMLFHTSNIDVVYVYTYEINLLKYDANNLVGTGYAGAALAGATFGVYYDEACEDPVMRYDEDPVNEVGEDYTTISDEEGNVIFYGLHEGTFYVKELEAPEGYVLSDEVIKIELNGENGTNVYNGSIANYLEPDQPYKKKEVEADGDDDFDDDGEKVEVGTVLNYKITYYNHHNEPADVIVIDKLDDGVTFIEASDGGEYDAKTHTVTWTISQVEAFTEGSVELSVYVTNEALAAGAVENTASVKVGNDAMADTNTIVNPVEEETGDTEPNPTPEPEDDDPRAPKKYVDADEDEDFHDNKQEISVGDELTYKITYYNNHAYADVVTITDTLDENLEYVDGSASDDGFYDEATRTITWYVGTEALTKGEVTFKVKVLSEAEEAGKVYNKATVQIGSDEAEETNELENPVKETSGSGNGSNPTGGTGTTGSTGTSGTSGSTASSVKTADETPVGPMAALMLAALAMMLAAFTYRKRRARR